MALPQIPPLPRRVSEDLSEGLMICLLILALLLTTCVLPLSPFLFPAMASSSVNDGIGPCGSEIPLSAHVLGYASLSLHGTKRKKS